MKRTKLFARSSERGEEGEVVAVGESIVIGSLVSGKAVKVSACFREMIAEETDADPDYFGSVDIENEDGDLIGEVAHVGFSQNGGITVQELAEVIPNQQWTVRRTIYQEHPQQR